VSSVKMTFYIAMVSLSRTVHERWSAVWQRHNSVATSADGGEREETTPVDLTWIINGLKKSHGRFSYYK
jgi:hypothetical protein